MRAQNAHRWYWILIVFTVALGLPGGCQKDHPSEPVSDDIRISRVEVDRSVLGLEDSTEVRALVMKGTATPAVGAKVVFGELLGQETGLFSKSESYTDAAGWARTMYRSVGADSGMVTLKVSIGSSIQYALLIISGRAAPAGLGLTFNTEGGATSIPADGRSDLAITIIARDGSGGAPVPSLPIVLTVGDHFEDRDADGVFSDGDVLPSSGDRNQNGSWDPEGTAPASVTTDSQGIARFTYHSGTTIGPVFMRATALGSAQELEILQHSVGVEISLATDAQELLADGVSSTLVTAQVLDWNDAPIPGVLVKFVSGEPFTDANGDGFYTGDESFVDQNGNHVWDAVGKVTSVVSTTYSGMAVARYEAGTRVGTVTIRATTTSGAAEVHLDLVEVPPTNSVVVRLQAPSLVADGQSTVNGVVEVKDLNGTPLAGKSVRLVAGERFEDVNGDGRFTPGSDVLIDDVDQNDGWSAIGTLPEIVVTGQDGTAPFTYTAGMQPADVGIRATVDGIGSEGLLHLEPLPPITAMEVASVFDRITVSHGGGLDRTTITATCFDQQGDPVPNGIPVTFRIFSGPGGGETIDGAERGAYVTSTDGEGRAAAVLMAGTTTGLIQVGVSAGSLMSSTGVFVGAGLAAQISCRADSVALDANETSLVYAYVYDENHNAVDDGTVVLIHADEGMIYTPGGGDRSETVNGIATATFAAVPNSGNGDGLAQITAETNGGINGAISCTTTIDMPPAPGAIDRIALEPSVDEIAVKGTGGVEQTRIFAQGFDALNTPVGPNRVITFRVAEGPSGGEHLNDGGTEATGTTNVLGIAEVILASGTVSGTVVVSAFVAGDPDITAHTPVGIAAGPPAFISVGMDSCNVYAAHKTGIENHVTVVVGDRYHNAVRNDTAVHFTTDHGMIVGVDALGTDFTNDGIAEADWYSDGTGGVIDVSAETYGGQVTNHTTFISSGDPTYITVISPPSKTGVLNADATSRLEFLVEVLDENHNFCLSGVGRATSLYGTPSIGPNEDGCNTSISRGFYIAPFLDQDYSYTIPDDGIGATDPVVVHFGYIPAPDTLWVELHTGRSSPQRSSVDLATVPPGAQSYFSVTVMDAHGNPLGGHVLSLTTTGGSVTSSATTDAFGMATGLIFQAPAVEGTVMLEIRDLDPGYGGNMILRQTVSISMP